MTKILNSILFLITGVFIISCAAPQNGNDRFLDIARYKTGMAYGLEIKDHYAYITTNSGLIILDIQNLKKPIRAGKLNMETPVFGVKVTDQKAFLAATDKGLIIVDVSNPEAPNIIGEFYDGGVVRRIGIVGQYCITSDFENGLNILDISDISKPVKTGNLKYNRIRNFVIAGEMVFLVDIGSGLRIVDISDKTNPFEITLVDKTEDAASVAIDGNRLFLGFFNGLIKIFDISDPNSPVLLTEIESPGEVLGMVSADNYLMINFRGLIIKDISDLNRIVDIGHYNRMKGSHGIVYRDGYVYYVKNGLTIFQILK